MKNFIMDFLRRGSSACGIGPIVLAVLYLILQSNGTVETLTASEVCTGIFSLTALAFIAGGMNAIYQIERLYLMPAILIHGFVLYVGYLVTYLLNDWLEWGAVPVFIFSGVFVVGYLVIWAVIYSGIRKNTEKVNAMLRMKREEREN